MTPAERIAELEAALAEAQGEGFLRRVDVAVKAWKEKVETAEAALAAERVKHKSNIAFMSTKCSELEQQRDAAAAAMREECAKIIDRKGQDLTNEHCHGDSGPDGYTWDNKEAEWQVILLEELADEFRSLAIAPEGRKIVEDARRYRKVRQGVWSLLQDAYSMVWCTDIAAQIDEVDSPEQFDADVDAAIAAKKGQS